MCLLYSEPGAGSDLAAVRTRADKVPESEGGGWRVTGQKVWTSGAAQADYGMLIARTDWDAPKHRGISFFFLPMGQPGVTVRPLHQITDESHFNEVFLDAAFVPEANLLGPLNGGWAVLQTALAYERSVMGDRARGPRSGAEGTEGRHVADRARARGGAARRPGRAAGHRTGASPGGRSTRSTMRAPRRSWGMAIRPRSCRSASWR